MEVVESTDEGPSLFEGVPIDEETGTLAEEVARIFAEDLTEEAAEALADHIDREVPHEEDPHQREEVRRTFDPPEEWFIRLEDGAIYLPARRRVQWLRTEHPHWSIATEIQTYTPGEWVSATNSIKGGSASVSARIERVEPTKSGLAVVVVATGHATEYSEAWHDFLEKAETSAIARACAVAGYGTEWATDLDEGAIADAPVRPANKVGYQQPQEFVIKIESAPPEQTEGVKVGGRQDAITDIQFAEIRRLARNNNLTPDVLLNYIDEFLTDDTMLSETLSREEVLAAIKTLTNEQAGVLIQHLSK
jgi:hypothetical protein